MKRIFFFSCRRSAEGRGGKMQKCRKAGAHTEVPGTFLCFFNLSLTLLSPHRQRGSAHMQAFGERGGGGGWGRWGGGRRWRSKEEEEESKEEEEGGL